MSQSLLVSPANPGPWSHQDGNRAASPAQCVGLQGGTPKKDIFISVPVSEGLVGGEAAGRGPGAHTHLSGGSSALQQASGSSYEALLLLLCLGEGCPTRRPQGPSGDHPLASCWP